MTTDEPKFSSNRIEAFSDGVFAIIITIMVLELRPPDGNTLDDLTHLWPEFLSYLLSFVYLIIYWNNHHHLLRTMQLPSRSIMWANSHLLLWLSLVPFGTSWLGSSGGATIPTALYGSLLLMSAIAYFLLQKAIIATHGTDSLLARALGNDFKGKISSPLYFLAIVFAFVAPGVSYVIFIGMALMWIIPDRRIERMIRKAT